MAAYKDLIGQKITKVTSNPGEPKTGQMWYNSTDGKLRGLGIVEAWSSASPMITGREFGSSGIGTQAANIVASGYDYGPGARVTNTEEYNGSGWTAITAINEGKFLAGGAGSTTAGLVFGGTAPPYTGNTEEYNGSSWSEQNNMGTARSVYCGAGGPSGQTAGLAAAGYNGSNVSNVEEYNGTSWSEVNNMSTARRAGTAFGTQTAASYATGYVSAHVNTVENTSGSAYSAKGKALTSVTPVASSTTAVCDFADISWTSASFTARGCMIFNDSATGDPSVCCIDFGGDKTATNGTFTVQFPTADSSDAIIRIA